jgi:uncharacterized protein YrrD
MRFKKDSEVFSSEGKKVGTVDRVVIDPSSHEVTHLVVSRGFLFKSDKVIPIEWIKDAPDGHINLKPNDQEIDDLPDFEKTQFISAKETMKESPYVNTSFWYPPPMVDWWETGMYAPYPMPRYIPRTEQNIPDNTLALEEGAKVYSKDNQHIGEIEQVIANKGNHIATHILIGKGFLLKEHKLIPTPWIELVEEDKVYLKINADILDNIPEYQQTS